ncbi:MAG: dihydrolipoyl dehydrogenase [Chromatiales bacterium]|nr:dihydrolipoyl dehydrogenase [Chromatiales bacterium]
MTETIAIKVPDIGDFDQVDVIEVLVKPGDEVAVEQSLITLESDKATMEIPSTAAGKVRKVLVAVGDKVGEGAAIVEIEAAGGAAAAVAPAAPEQKPAEEAKAASVPVAAAGTAPDSVDITTEVVVLGAGPGGYTAAFRAADLGKRVVLIERFPQLGGVCLNVGCIPSKALLHTAEILHDVAHCAERGVRFGAPEIDIEQMRRHKAGVVAKLTDGLAGLAKRRKVEVVTGVGRFMSPNTIEVDNDGVKKTVGFEHCIIAAGSRVTKIDAWPNEDPRMLDSTGALELADIPERLLVVGGGIIGLEMATVYQALGSKVTVVELTDQLMPGADADLVRAFTGVVKKRYEAIYLGTRVTAIEAADDGMHVSFEGGKAPASATFDRVLVAIGRRPNGDRIDAQAAGVEVDARGFIAVDAERRTNVPHIYAIGDICGQPMLAHKATHEAKVAAESIAGHKVAFEPLTIPSVAYTNPEVAWMGLSEAEAKAKDIEVDVAKFPWAASGRALGIGATDGVTKLVFEKETRRLLGAGIVGRNAGELIAETVLALEMGADMDDLGLTIHPHPTLAETVCFGAEMAAGTITDLYVPKRERKS